MAHPNSLAARLVRAIDAVVVVVGKAVAWLILPMVLSLVWEVTARYGFNAPTEWAYDMTFMLYGTFFMVGSAYTLYKKGHIRTDSYYANWSTRTQGWVDTICYLLFFGFGLALMGRAGATACLAISVVIFVLQAAASRWWLAHYNFGPMEWLWRWWTYSGRPLLRRAVA